MARRHAGVPACPPGCARACVLSHPPQRPPPPHTHVGAHGAFAVGLGAGCAAHCSAKAVGADGGGWRWVGVGLEGSSMEGSVSAGTGCACTQQAMQACPPPHPPASHEEMPWAACPRVGSARAKALEPVKAEAWPAPRPDWEAAVLAFSIRLGVETPTPEEALVVSRSLRVPACVRAGECAGVWGVCGGGGVTRSEQAHTRIGGGGCVGRGLGVC